MRVWGWLAVMLVACGGKSDDSGDTASSTGTTTAPTGTATAGGGGTGTGGATGLSHAADVQPIWDAKCTPCHIVTSSGNLNITEGHSAQVGVPSTQATDLNLIEPGDPSKSYTWLKLQDTHDDAGGFGSAMPQGGSLSSDELATIETWILEGAAP